MATFETRGVENPRVVDLITTDSGRVVIVMIERRPWDSTRQRLEQLNDKLDSYFTYVVDGHLTAQYPEYAGVPVAIRLDTVHQPTGEGLEMLRSATELAERLGMAFVVRLVEPDEIAPAPWETAQEG